MSNLTAKSANGLIGTAFLLCVSMACQAFAAETKTHTVRNKASSGATCTSVKIAKNNGDMTVTPPAGATVTGPKAGETGTWEITGLAITPGTEATFTFDNANGTVNFRFLSYDYTNDAGKTVWTGKCNDPIAYHVVTGGPGGDNYLGYPIPSGHYGYFYQMYPNPTNSTTVMQAHIHLGPDSGAYNFQVLPNTFPHLSNPGFDLDDIEVPVIDAPDGYEYEVLVPYMDPANATGLPGIPTLWNYDPISGTATMNFGGAGGLSMGQTGSIVAFTSPYPPTVTPGNVTVDYQGGVEPPCTGNFAPDALVPDVPDVPQYSFQALPELGGGSSMAFNINAPVAIDGGEGVDTIVVIGQSRDLDLIDKAVVWSRPNGVTWQITPLPNPFGNHAGAGVFSYIPVQPNFADLINSIGGHADDSDGRPQPVLWTLDGGGLWVANPVPLPPGMDSGALLDGVGTTLPESIRIQSAGWVGQGTEHHAVYCDMDTDGGGWTQVCSPLPDNGPGLPSEATCLTHDNVHEDDVHIGGASATPTSPMVPSVWQPLPGGGFERIDLPMAPGSYIGLISRLMEEEGIYYAVGHNASVAGLADLYRGVVYRRSIGEVWNQPLVLPPLPGMRDSRATSISVGPDATTGHKLYVGGLSYTELSPGSERATLWEIAPDETIITYDLNALTVNLPPDVVLSTRPVVGNIDADPEPEAFVGNYFNLASPTTPHAMILTPPPPPDPLRTISPTQVVFGSDDVPPIPADFFGPGSLPFEGLVDLKGRSIPENSFASTAIQRSTEMNCPGTGPFPRPCDPIPIEIVALDLVSINPIIVSGPSESLWNVEVSLSSFEQPQGGLGAQLEHDNGGTYGCFLPVVPVFTFTNADNPSDIRILDYGDTGNPPIQLQFGNVPWVASLAGHLSSQVVAPSNGNFVPHVHELVPGDPLSQAAVVASGLSAGGGVIHTVGPQPPPPPPDPHRTISPTFVQFGTGDVPSFPADFFYPGCLPFEGTVYFSGAAQDSQDTLVQRSGVADFSEGPVSSLLVRALSLKLKSIDPLVVTDGQGQESAWDVDVELCDPSICDGNGMDDTIDIYLSHPNGGTFDATVPILPVMTFTRVGDPLDVRTLNYGSLGYPPIRVQFTGVPWVRDLAPHLQGIVHAPSDGNFVPGVQELIPGDPASQIAVQATGISLGGGVNHTIGPPVGPRLIPAGEDCWETVCGDTNYDFSATPIPLGFFNVEPDDNTLGYTDMVRLEDLGINTFVRRCADAVFDTALPSSVDVPIELTSLNLRSCDPIAVQDCCKPAELWNVEVTLSPTLPPACSGAMTMTKTHDNGGTFTSQFPVQALFRFTRVNPPTITYEFDTALAGYLPEMMGASQPIDFVQRLYDPDVARACGVNFVPGVEEFLGRNPTEQYPQCCTPPRCHQFLGGSLHCPAPVDCSKCPGACCDPVTGACSHVTLEQCTSVSGTFKGIRSKCEDTDADGIADDFETGTCCGPRDSCYTGTDPNNPDSDGDGVLDGDELTLGSDACDPCDPNPLSPGCPPQGSDCNGNTTLDVCDVANGTSADCDDNQVPDECQPDCDFDACADACEIICGSQIDANENGIPDDCESGVPTPVADPFAPRKNRFISFHVPVSGATALRVRLVSLHHVSPPYTGGPSVPFTVFEGEVRWVGPPVQYIESTASPSTFYASFLQCTPHYQDWSTAGYIHVTGSAIVPSSTYEVENLAASCMGNEAGCPDVSLPLAIGTTRWGDVESPFNPPSPTTQPDLADVSALVNKFRGAIGSPIKARALLVGVDAFGTIDIAPDFSFIHIAGCVDAFRGRPYPHTIAACP